MQAGLNRRRRLFFSCMTGRERILSIAAAMLRAWSPTGALARGHAVGSRSLFRMACTVLRELPAATDGCSCTVQHCDCRSFDSRCQLSTPTLCLFGKQQLHLLPVVYVPFLQKDWQHPSRLAPRMGQGVCRLPVARLLCCIAG
jgi:hypothetical protein